MRFLYLIPAIALLASPALAQALPTAVADCSIASLTGSSQQLVAANPQRKYLQVYNSGANTIYLNLSGGTAASSGASSVAVASAAYATVIQNSDVIMTNKVTVTGTSTQPVTCYEGR